MLPAWLGFLVLAYGVIVAALVVRRRPAASRTLLVSLTLSFAAVAAVVVALAVIG